MSDILSVRKALDIIEVISISSPQSMGTRELARRIGINVTSAHNIATTLAGKGFLRKTVRPRGWKLGYHLLNIASAENFETFFTEIAKTPVWELFKELQETIMLTSIYENRMSKLIYITAKHQVLKAEEPQDIRPFAHCTACGKIMLAGLEKEMFNDYLKQNKLEKYTKQTISSTSEMAGEISRIKKNGYSETRDELCDGISALAVPIKEPSGKTIAGLGTSVPSVRFTRQWRKNAISKLKQTAKRIETELESS